jgi:hypothetical protein
MEAQPGLAESISSHRLALARELIDDLELARLAPEALLLKASRLARLVEAPRTQEWLQLELRGYESLDSSVAKEYAGLTGRYTDKAKGLGYWQPLAALMASVQAWDVELRSLRVPDIQFSLPPVDQMGGGWTQMHVQAATAPIGNVMQRMSTLSTSVATLRAIVSKVTAVLHEFVARTYYELAFRGLAESIFDAHRKEIDALLAKAAGESLEKIPAIAERLANGDPEAISHALTTGRRVLATFADAMQPPQEAPLHLGGTSLVANGEHYLNRLKYFIATHCASDRRKDRLKDTVVHLNTRFAAGVHADVATEEARSLFVLLYVTLGEVLSLKSS